MPKVKLLRALAQYHYLTTELATRLLYAHGSLRGVQDDLKSLYEEHYLDLVIQARYTTRGSLPYVYRLAHKGKRYIHADTGQALPRTEGRRKAFLDHTLAVAEFLILVEFVAARVPGWVVRSAKHDLTLRREERGAVIPDGLLDLRVPVDGENYDNPLALELDRGTEDDQTFWRAKVRHLVRWVAGRPMTIAVVVEAEEGEKRAKQLQAWTEAELRSMGAQGEADLFRISAVPLPDQDLGDADYLREAYAYLVSQRWLVPLGETAPLIDLGGGDA